MELDIYMERIISQEERIRRAEELYYKRKNQTGVRVSTATVNLKENKCTLGKKMIIQLLVCLSIYMCIHIIKTNNTIISEQLISEINKILSYDINFQKLYSKCIEEVGKYYSFTTIEENKYQVDNYVDNIFINRIKQDYIIEKKEEPPLSEEIKTDVGIGGGSEIVEQNINKSQMELDAEYIKQKGITKNIKVSIADICSNCKGSGKNIDFQTKQCERCCGRGYIYSEKTIAVKIPASGPTPEARASAIESGNAIIATMIPEMISFTSCSFTESLQGTAISRLIMELPPFG